MAAIDTARAASLAARQNKALDKLWRFDGVVTTFRATLEAGEYAYRYEHVWHDGTVSRGLITHESAAEAIADSPEGGRSFYPGQSDPLQGLQFATYRECPKLVSDYAAHLPLVRISADSFEIVTA